MTKIIIYQDVTLDDFYQMELEYLHSKYHQYSTNHEKADQADRDDQSYYDAMGQVASDILIGKTVF